MSDPDTGAPTTDPAGGGGDAVSDQADAREAVSGPGTERPGPRRAWTDNLAAQIAYHDAEAADYDAKWAISFDQRCTDYARQRFTAITGPDDMRHWPYRDALEIGAGTGFFGLNLRLAGVLGRLTVTDVSPGMVDVARDNAQALGLELSGEVCDAEHLVFPDDSFDLVVGHAVLHHIPDVEQALREVVRVLRPGGRFVVAGEPTTVGDWYARRLGRVTWAAATRLTRLGPLRERWGRTGEELSASSEAHALESVVDLHTFDPDELARMALRAGAVDVSTSTEELTAAWLGWPVRTVEAAVRPGSLGMQWATFAYRSWLRLSALDRRLAKVVPQRFFYNAGLTGVKPG